MYIEIEGGQGFPGVDKVTIKFHEGVLHNKTFNVPASVVLPLLMKKKIKINPANISATENQCMVRDLVNKNSDVKKFFEELQKVSE